MELNQCIKFLREKNWVRYKNHSNTHFGEKYFVSYKKPPLFGGVWGSLQTDRVKLNSLILKLKEEKKLSHFEVCVELKKRGIRTPTNKL